MKTSLHKKTIKICTIKMKHILSLQLGEYNLITHFIQMSRQMQVCKESDERHWSTGSPTVSAFFPLNNSCHGGGQSLYTYIRHVYTCFISFTYSHCCMIISLFVNFTFLLYHNGLYKMNWLNSINTIYIHHMMSQI